MNQPHKDEQLGDRLAAFAFGTVAMLVLAGGPLAVYWTVSGRSALGFACFGAFALGMLVAAVWAWRVKL